MILPRRLVLVLWFLAAGALAAPTPAPPGAPPVFPDERAARLAERYKAMLAANPTEGLALDRLWKAYQDAGAAGQLVEEYHRAADASPAAAPLLVYGHLLKKAGRLDEAATVYDRAATADPTSALPTFAQGELALARSRPADAAARFEAALGQLPANDRRRGDLLLKTGDAWQAAGEPLKAAEAWEKTVALAPGDLNLHRRLAANYEKNALPERAIAHHEYVEAHADPAGRAAALRELGRLHETHGNFDAARDALERGLALTARDNWLYGDLQTRFIRLYQRAGRVPELEARWQKVVETAPRDLGGYARLEALAEAQGDLAGERRWLEKIVELSPRDRDDTLKLARLLADNGERAAAVTFYDKLLHEQPGNLDLVLARADLDVQGGQPEAAAARVEARIAQNPADESVTTPALEFFLSRHLNAASEKLLRAQAVHQPDATEPALALAKFLFAERQAGPARQVLNDLAARPGDAAARAARWMAVADVYKEQNLPDDALRSLQQATGLQPATAAPLLAASDLFLARGDATGAADPLRRAIDLTPAGPERVEVERKLFQVLQTAGASTRDFSSPEEVGRPYPFAASGVGGVSLDRRGMLVGPRPASPAAPSTDGVDTPLGRYFAELRKLAADEPTADHSLRLARWLSWAGSLGDATSAAEKAIELDPDNLPARELLVSLAVDTHHHDAAEMRLREIMVLDPSRQPACLRQIAALEIQDNELDEALAIYEELQKAAPGSVEALSDLATAQERADRWYDALANWERASALPGLTPAQRADVRRPLLLAYERLEQFPRAAEILLASVDAQADLPAREDLFRELSVFCRKHDLSGWLEMNVRNRLAAQPNDYFTLTALAALSRDAGREREAYKLLEKAYYSASDPVNALRVLVDSAGALGENEEAIVHQRRLAALPGQATVENLEKLADLQSGSLDADAAARTWDQIVARFPRDPNCLELGADFFENAGRIGRARELLGQVVALEANNPRRLYHLARLDIDAGDAASARGLLAQLLADTDPEKVGDPFVPPPELDFNASAVSGILSGIASHRARALGLLAPAAASAPAESDDRHLRLDAIREWSRLLLASGTDAERRSWLDRWRAAAASGSRGEPLAAFFYAGEKTLTMDLLTGWVRGAPGIDRIRNAFLTAGLRLGEYRALAQWAWRDATLAHRAERGQWLLGALQQFLNGGGKPGPGMTAELFPPEVKLRETLWEAASTAFADRHWYTQAAELGTRVYALVPGSRSDYALKIAQWELYAGNLGHAKALLRNAVESDHSETFETSGGSVFTALRAYLRLLPEGERVTFRDDYLQRMRDAGTPVHATLAAILLHGMAGDDRAAEEEVGILLKMRLLSSTAGGGTPDARRWNYILNNGNQLLAWDLDPLAGYYWRRALREASAFERQDGDAINAQTEIRGRLLGVEVASADSPQQVRERVEDYLRTGPAWEAVASEASQLLAASQFPAAAQLYEAIVRARPGDAESWLNLFAAYGSAGDHATLERTLDRLLAAPLPTGLNRLDLVNRLVNLRRAEGDHVGACRLLEQAVLAIHDAPGLLPELAQAQERAGRWEQAARTWTQALSSDPSGGARIALAAVEERLGRADHAIALLDDTLRTGPEPARFTAAGQLMRLYLAARRLDDARALGTRILQDGPANALPETASALARGGLRPFARELLTAAVRRARDLPGRYRAQHALLADVVEAGDDLAVFTREARRLETFARSDPASQSGFAMVRYRLARHRGADAWLEEELKQDWDGSKGDLAAGERLIDLYLDTRREDGLREVVNAIDHHPDLPEQLLHTLEEQLVQTHHGALALPMLERLRRRFPQNDAYALDQARALWQAGRREEAAHALDEFEAAAVFRDDLSDETAMVYLELGDRVKAREKLEALVGHDFPVVHESQAALALARMDTEDGRASAARGWLRRAYRNPACVDFAPLVESALRVAAPGKDTPRRAMPGGDVPLTPPHRAQVLSETCARLLGKGQVPEARAWVEAHSELLAGAPGLVAELRRAMSAGDLPALTAIVDSAAGQADPPAPGLNRALAALYAEWAELEMAVDPAGASKHLSRALELSPDDFNIAEKLATVCMAQKQNDRAAAALAGFLGADALPDERARAQQILGGVDADGSS